VAFFGQKDAAQAAIIRRMVRDLNFPVEIAIGAIVREPDGLAMSSRNAYLNSEQRKVAPVLHKALRKIQSLFDGGERDAAKLTAVGQQEFTNQPCVRLDYLEIVDPDTLEPVTNVSDRSLVAVAAFFGQTRLIDNIVLEPKTAQRQPPPQAAEKGRMRLRSSASFAVL
jgi:pantoate--beta-alanine ligase